MAATVIGPPRLAPASPAEPLLALLDLEPAGERRFLAPNPGDSRRIFGGQVAAQALWAAGATVEAGRAVHSIHAYFLRPGRGGVALEVEVEEGTDGIARSTRTVVVRQDGEAIFGLGASFQRPRPGLEHALGAPAAPAPEGLPPREHGGRHHRPLDSREVEVAWDPGTGTARRLWFRVRGPLPDDPLLHACGLLYGSDMGPLGAVRRPARAAGVEPAMAASLDHAVWFHRPARADEWLLYDLTAVSSSGGRGLCWATLHTADGTLVATVAQEGLARPSHRREADGSITGRSGGAA